MHNQPPDIDYDEERYIDNVLEKSKESLANHPGQSDDVYVTFQAVSVIYLIERYKHLMSQQRGDLKLN